MPEFPQSHSDLLERDFATLATLGRDGAPQLSEVWFLFEEGALKLSLNTARQKTKNLIARPKCSLFLLDLQNPYRYIDVRGHASVEPDDDYVFADRVGAKYGSNLRQHDQPGDKRVLVRIEPEKIYAVDMSS